MLLQVQLEHGADQEDATAWEVGVDHTVTPQCDGSESVLVEVTITGTSVLGLGFSSRAGARRLSRSRKSTQGRVEERLYGPKEHEQCPLLQQVN